jgi:hypothetical protein
MCQWNRPCAQVSVENVVTTDSVDLFSEHQGKEKSATLAMALSLLLPGTGHQYFERNRSALSFFTAEAVGIFGFFFCNHYAKKLASNAAGYAWVHSGAQGPITSADDNYWKQVGSYMDIQDYNNTQDLNRTPQDKFTDPSQVWHWDDKSSQDRFNSILSSSRTFGIASSFFIGALVLDRIIAFIDIRTATRNRGVKQTGFTLSSLYPMVSISPSSMDLRLQGLF